MPLLFIHAHDAEFASHDEGAEYDQPETAMAVGVDGAIAFLAGEISRGERNAAVEVSVERADGTQVLRSIVAVSVSPLLPMTRPPSSSTCSL
ncbi:DUF6894 family protein [Roseomonas sp. WA12]